MEEDQQQSSGDESSGYIDPAIWEEWKKHEDKMNFHNQRVEFHKQKVSRFKKEAFFDYSSSNQCTPTVITITGKSRSGKDTAADYYVQKLNKMGFKTRKIALADRLKLMTQQLIKLFYNIDLPIEYFYDSEEKEKQRYAGTIGGVETYFTIRTMLQQIGTDVIRKHLWEDIWCDIVSKKCITTSTTSATVPNDIIIIPDCRTQNEVDFFEKLKSQNMVDKVISIKLIRDESKKNSSMREENKNHESEKQTLKVKTNFLIDNNYSLEQLELSLDIILEKSDIKGDTKSR